MLVQHTTSATAAGHIGAMMNKKIESLANVWANRRREEEGLGIVYVFSEKALQVFADKIVKECVSAVNSADDSCTDYWGDIIKEHFGVEE